MMSRKALLAAAIGGLVSLQIPVVNAADENVEKCYGVAKAGKNDCAGAAHACAGQAKKDGGATEWIKLPKGTCERLVGGSLAAKK
ncbi:MAG: DUF2282 domain-containing protein [Steroidobacteraceae bacterium]